MQSYDAYTGTTVSRRPCPIPISPAVGTGTSHSTGLPFRFLNVTYVTKTR